MQAQTPAQKAPNSHPDMPFGFSLICEDPSPCPLAYPETAKDKAIISAEEIVKSLRKVIELSRLSDKVNRLLSWTTSVLSAILLDQILLMLVYTSICVYTSNLSANLPGNKMELKTLFWGFMDDHFSGTLLAQIVVLLLLKHWPEASFSNVKWNLVFGLVLIVVGIWDSIGFFFPVTAHQFETAKKAKETVKELYRLVTGPEKGVEAVFVEPPTIEDPEEPVSRPSRERSTPELLPRLQERGSAATTVQEDNFVEPEAVQDDHVNNAWAETDSESDFDGEPFVDLAGVITPTTQNEESDDDVVVVDA